MLYYSEIRKIKYFLDPPKKAQGYERSRYVFTHRWLSIQSARDLDIHWVDIEQFEWFGLLSNPFIEKYYLIVVVFSCPHFSIYDIFYTLENTRSFNERATHFKFNNLLIHCTCFHVLSLTTSLNTSYLLLCIKFNNLLIHCTCFHVLSLTTSKYIVPELKLFFPLLIVIYLFPAAWRTVRCGLWKTKYEKK